MRDEGRHDAYRGWTGTKGDTLREEFLHAVAFLACEKLLLFVNLFGTNLESNGRFLHCVNIERVRGR
jgi:hypothetical protein